MGGDSEDDERRGQGQNPRLQRRYRYAPRIRESGIVDFAVLCNLSQALPLGWIVLRGFDSARSGILQDTLTGQHCDRHRHHFPLQLKHRGRRLNNFRYTPARIAFPLRPQCQPTVVR